MEVHLEQHLRHKPDGPILHSMELLVLIVINRCLERRATPVVPQQTGPQQMVLITITQYSLDKEE